MWNPTCFKAIHPSLVGKDNMFIYAEDKEPLENWHPHLLDDPEFSIQEVSKESILLEQVPEEFRAKLSYMAYERGHSSGQEECYYILKALIADLFPAIKEFETRIRNSCK